MLIHEYNYAEEKKINHGKLIFFYFYSNYLLKNSFLKRNWIKNIRKSI